jgi:type I restriction enzyme S subunit
MPEKWAEEYPEFLIGPHELVMNLTAQSLKDEFLGRVCVTGAGERCLLNQRLARLTPIVVVARYLLYMFKSKHFRQFVDTLNKGSLIQHMFTSQLEGFAFPLPPLREQHRIVGSLDAALSTISHLDSVCASQTARMRSVKASVLRWAFSGRLVNQDPTDEPASILLDRVGVSQAASSLEAPRRRGRPHKAVTK